MKISRLASQRQVLLSAPQKMVPSLDKEREQPTTTMGPRSVSRQRFTRRQMMKIAALLAAIGIGGGLGWRVGWHPFVYRGHTKSVNGVAWSPNGQRLASVSDDGSSQVWDARDGSNASVGYIAPVNQTDAPAPVTSVAWSPDSTRIAVATAAGDIFAWGDYGTPFAYTTWQVAMATAHGPAMNALAWSPDGTRIAAACADGSVQIWDSLNRVPFWPNTPAALVYRGHGASVKTLAWSPDGGRMVSGSEDGMVLIWDAVTGTTDESAHIVTKTPVTAVAWEPAGWNVLFATEGGWMSFWNANEDETANSYLWEGDRINALSWSPDGRQFAMGKQSGAIDIWSSASVLGSDAFKPLATDQPHNQAINALSWSPDGAAIASASADATIRVAYLNWWR